MSRTAHHIPLNRRHDFNHDAHQCAWATGDGHHPYDCAYRGPANTVRDLRYSTAALAAAHRNGARPVPTLVTATLAHRARSAERYVNLDERGPRANIRERAVRTHTRDALSYARAIANDALRDADVDALDEIDIAPTRHRNSALWDIF